jgi:hypothetical protein
VAEPSGELGQLLVRDLALDQREQLSFPAPDMLLELRAELPQLRHVVGLLRKRANAHVIDEGVDDDRLIGIREGRGREQDLLLLAKVLATFGVSEDEEARVVVLGGGLVGSLEELRHDQRLVVVS